MKMINPLRLIFKDIARDENGSTVVFIAAAIVPIVAFVGIAIDTGRGYMLKQRLSYAVEAAALAAAKSSVSATDAEIEAAGQKIFDANFSAGYMGTKNLNLTFTISANKKQIGVDADADMPTALMTVVGVDKVGIGTNAIALRESKGLELAIALDNTGSMNGYIDDLQDASHELLDVLYGDEETIENLWVSILPFDTRVNLANYSSVISFPPSNPSRVCANPRPSPYTNDDAPPSASAFNSEWTLWSYGCKAKPALALTAEKSTLEGVIDSMAASGYTRVDEAASWAFRMLSAEWTGVWGNPSLPKAFNTPLMDKAAIIMTDGENVPKDGTSKGQANSRLKDACDAMKAENIIVYTVQFRTNSNSLQNLLKNCATSDAHYFYAEEDDLTAVFSEIANQLSNLRLININ